MKHKGGAIIAITSNSNVNLLVPLVVGTETLVAAGHVKKNLLEGWGIFSSSQPNVLEYLPTLRFWMDRWSRDQPQPGSLFQRLREAEKRHSGNKVVLQQAYMTHNFIYTRINWHLYMLGS